MITTHPAFAVIAVLLGALSSIFAGRLLSIGLTDIQGALGVSADYMSWVNTSYNAASMFIGPMTVFMGNLLGARRILLAAGSIFMLAEFLSPFAGSNAFALIATQTVAGLAAGTFYPLTFTIIMRNFPVQYVYLGIGVYALDIVASTHFGHFVESYYMTYLSWQWLFWNALITTPFMMFCAYFGIPKQDLPQKTKGLTFWGFLYASCGLTLIYVGLDQAERLDWFNSPLVVAFIGTGLFFLGLTLFERHIKPNPMLNLKFLASRNFLLLGAVLIGFRFTLLSSTLLIPNYLSVIHGYRPEQTGSVLGWISIPILLFAPLSGLLLYKFDSRLLCAFGFFLIGASCIACSQINPGWTGETFFVSQLFFACGLAASLVGLIASIVHSALASGAMKEPVNILTLSCWLQTCRLFGAETGKAFMSHFLKVQSDLHYNILAAHIDGDWLTQERIGQLAAITTSASQSLAPDATILASSLKQQVLLLSTSDGFILVSIISLATIVAIGCLRECPPLTQR